MEIYETHVTPQKDGLSEYRVEFVLAGAKRVAVILKDEVPGVFNEQALVAKARALLDEADASGVRGELPSYRANNQNNARADVQEQQPVQDSNFEKPESAQNPEPEQKPTIGGVKNGGVIET